MLFRRHAYNVRSSQKKKKKGIQAKQNKKSQSQIKEFPKEKKAREQKRKEIIGPLEKKEKQNPNFFFPPIPDGVTGPPRGVKSSMKIEHE
jgi:hypothetical protein